MTLPLMPKATAVWLIKNTTLTFEQIADFCGMHSLEVRAIADGEVAIGIIGFDPVANSQLTREEIERCEYDPQEHLCILHANHPLPQIRSVRPQETRYTPVSKRRDRPDAIAWLLIHCPELSDLQICRLIGTTKSTISSIRNKTHWKILSIKPRNPVMLGLCSQEYLESALIKAQRGKQALNKKSASEQEENLSASDNYDTAEDELEDL